MKLIKPTKPIDFKPTLKQHEVWQYLTNNIHTIIMFGGGSGGGKTYIGVSWCILMCMQYPGVVYAVCRSRLVTLKKTTLISLLSVLKDFNLEEGKQYTFDRTLNIITFWNESKIILFDTFPYPSDENYDRFGSYSFTGILLDEASETSVKAYNVMQTRLRHLLKEYNLIPKLFIVSNPTNGWLKNEIYRPYVDGTLPEHIAVVISKATDNPYLDLSYVENLKRLDPITRSRMLDGNWDFQDMDASIFKYDKIIQMYYNTNFINKNTQRYLTCDIASTGNDKTCIMVWEGLEVMDIHLLLHKTTPQIVNFIKELMNNYHIQIKNVIIDKQGVGTGTYELLKGSVGFVANERPTNNIYDMIKSELYYKLAEYINNDKIYVSCDKYMDELSQELISHTMYDFDKDGKTKILPKDKVKQKIGRSPDLSDSMMMRMYFEVKKSDFKFTFV